MLVVTVLSIVFSYMLIRIKRHLDHKERLFLRNIHERIVNIKSKRYENVYDNTLLVHDKKFYTHLEHNINGIWYPRSKNSTVIIHSGRFGGKYASFFIGDQNNDSSVYSFEVYK